MIYQGCALICEAESFKEGDLGYKEGDLGCREKDPGQLIVSLIYCK